MDETNIIQKFKENNPKSLFIRGGIYTKKIY